MNNDSIQAQYRDLFFALYDAWPMVKECNDEALKRECSSIMRENGDFAVKPAKIGPALNRRIYFALERAQRVVAEHPWVSNTRKDQVRGALSKHADSKEDWIRSGNAPDSKPPERDFSMRPKEYWETRLSPAQPHHWTRAEFLKHLSDHRFPPNTIKDRLEVHVQVIRDALLAGEYVPAEVLADEAGQQAIGDALLRVRSDAYAKAASEAQESNRQMFFQARVGYEGEFLQDLLSQAAAASIEAAQPGLDPWLASGYKLVEPNESYPHGIMVCALGDSKGGRIDFRDARYEPNSLFGTVHSIRMDEAATIFCRLLDEGRVTTEEVQSVIGYESMQYLARPVVQAVYPRGG